MFFFFFFFFFFFWGGGQVGGCSGGGGHRVDVNKENSQKMGAGSGRGVGGQGRCNREVKFL